MQFDQFDQWENVQHETSKRKQRESTIIIYFGQVSWSHESLRFHDSSIYLKNFFLQIYKIANDFCLNLSGNSVAFQTNRFHFFFLNISFVNANSIQTAQKHSRCHFFVCVSKSSKSIRISFLLLSHSISRVTFFCTLSFVQMPKS